MLKKKKAAVNSIPNHQLCTLPTLDIIKVFSFCQSSGWKMIFHFNSPVVNFSLFSYIGHVWFFFYQLPICSFAHFVCYVNSRAYVIDDPDPSLAPFVSLWLVPMSSWGSRPRTHGWKGKGCRFGLKVKKIRKSFRCQGRGRMFTEDLLCAKDSTNYKLPSCEEGRY